jgi:hypothetical protein
MFRSASLVGGLALAAASVAYAQQPTTPPVPEDALSPRELIAWTSLQIPRPAQEALPANLAPPNQADQDFARRPPRVINSDGQGERARPTQPLVYDSRSRTQ